MSKKNICEIVKDIHNKAFEHINGV